MFKKENMLNQLQLQGETPVEIVKICITTREAPTRNVRNPKDTTRGKTTRGDIHCTGFGVQSARGPAQGQGVR